MCVTTLKSRLSKTRIGVWDVEHPDYGYRHVLAYQNRVKNLVPSPNCMMLHIPTQETLTPDFIINTEDNVELLVNMSKDIFGWSRSLEPSDNFVVQMGVYHIALLNQLNSMAVQESLHEIPKEKRPEIPESFLEFYQKQFPNFPLILCCFNNQDALDASPIMVHFEPKHKDVFMFNTLDSHGDLPEIGKEITFHQTIITGSYQLQEEGNGFRPFTYHNVNEDLLRWLPSYGIAAKLENTLPNKDLLIEAHAVRIGGNAKMDLGFLN